MQELTEAQIIQPKPELTTPEAVLQRNRADTPPLFRRRSDYLLRQATAIMKQHRIQNVTELLARDEENALPSGTADEVLKLMKQAKEYLLSLKAPNWENLQLVGELDAKTHRFDYPVLFLSDGRAVTLHATATIWEGNTPTREGFFLYETPLVLPNNNMVQRHHSVAHELRSEYKDSCSLWDTTKNLEIAMLGGRSPIYHPDGYIYTQDPTSYRNPEDLNQLHNIYVWDAETGAKVKTIVTTLKQRLAGILDNGNLLTPSYLGEASAVWNATMKNRISEIPVQFNAAQSVQTAEGNLIIPTSPMSSDRYMVVIDPKTGKEIKRSPTPEEDVSFGTPQIDFQGNIATILHRGKNIAVFNPKEGTVMYDVIPLSNDTFSVDSIQGISISPQGQVAVLAKQLDMDGNARGKILLYR